MNDRFYLSKSNFCKTKRRNWLNFANMSTISRTTLNCFKLFKILYICVFDISNIDHLKFRLLSSCSLRQQKGLLGQKVILPDGRTNRRTDGRTAGLWELDLVWTLDKIINRPTQNFPNFFQLLLSYIAIKIIQICCCL